MNYRRRCVIRIPEKHKFVKPATITTVEPVRLNKLHKIDDETVLPLITWFQNNRRILPWRNTNDPYDVWLSEIMLQQTRVEFVKERFIRFKQALPDISSLAAVSDDDLLKLWEGMGYYSRARNLKKCAGVLVNSFNGCLPADYKTLLSLPGIGPYTAGAIASIAFGIPVPAVDGNVLRVFARLNGDTRDIRSTEVKADVTSVLSDYLNQDHSSLPAQKPDLIPLFTQSWMELGALICLPNGKPRCEFCPLADHCKANQNQLTEVIPYRSPLKRRRIEERTILVIRDGSRFLLHKRPETGLLAGLYEFPGMEGSYSKEEVIQYVESQAMHVLHIKPLPPSRHIFSHVEWHMTAFEVQIADLGKPPAPDRILLTKKELQKFAVPSAFAAYKAYYEWNS